MHLIHQAEIVESHLHRIHQRINFTVSQPQANPYVQDRIQWLLRSKGFFILSSVCRQRLKDQYVPLQVASPERSAVFSFYVPGNDEVVTAHQNPLPTGNSQAPKRVSNSAFDARMIDTDPTPLEGRLSYTIVCLICLCLVSTCFG